MPPTRPAASAAACCASDADVTVLEFSADGRRWRAELSAAVDLAIPLEFDGAQPRFFAEQPARAEPLRVGGFSGSVALGASCNCAVHTLAPHCHGTHTECVGHVTSGGTVVAAVTPVPPSLALLVSLRPEVLASIARLAPGEKRRFRPLHQPPCARRRRRTLG